MIGTITIKGYTLSYPPFDDGGLGSTPFCVYKPIPGHIPNYETGEGLFILAAFNKPEDAWAYFTDLVK